MKILNLDELETSVEKTLILKGVKHAFKPFTVEEFISSMKTAEQRDKESSSVSELVEYMVEMITRSFPTVPVADLCALDVARLRTISDFVNDVVDEENAGAPEDDVTGDKEAPNEETAAPVN